MKMHHPLKSSLLLTSSYLFPSLVLQASLCPMCPSLQNILILNSPQAGFLHLFLSVCILSLGSLPVLQFHACDSQSHRNLEFCCFPTHVPNSPPDPTVFASYLSYPSPPASQLLASSSFLQLMLDCPCHPPFPLIMFDLSGTTSSKHF